MKNLIDFFGHLQNQSAKKNINSSLEKDWEELLTVLPTNIAKIIFCVLDSQLFFFLITIFYSDLILLVIKIASETKTDDKKV